MKKTAIFVLMISLLLIAGCTTPSSPSGSPGAGISLPSPFGSLSMGKPHAQSEYVILGSGNRTYNASIHSFEIDPAKENGDQTITIYVSVKNIGTEPSQLVWFSKLTDLNGKTYGGIGISHAGSGARTYWLNPGGIPEAARDYVTIRSDRDLETLKKGAVLDVYFMEKYPNTTISDKPDYHATWTIDPGSIS